MTDPKELITLCPGFFGLPLPCSLMFSRISERMNVFYPIIIVIFAVFRLRISLSNLIKFTSENFRNSYEGEGSKHQITQMFFNAWEWKVDSEKDSSALRMATMNMINTEIAEQDKRKEIALRPPEYWTKLYIKRAVLISINWLVMMACVSGVVLSNVYKNELIEWANIQTAKYPKLPPQVTLLAEAAPTIILSLCNGIINPFSVIITGLEDYDFNSDKVNQQISRIWVGTIVNLMIFVIMQFQLAFGKKILVDQDQIIFNGNDGTYDCPEDEASMMFLQLIVTETIVKAITLLTAGIAPYILNRVIKKQQEWKPEFKDSEEIVWVLYF